MIILNDNAIAINEHSNYSSVFIFCNIEINSNYYYNKNRKLLFDLI